MDVELVELLLSIASFVLFHNLKSNGVTFWRTQCMISPGKLRGKCIDRRCRSSVLPLIPDSILDSSSFAILTVSILARRFVRIGGFFERILCMGHIVGAVWCVCTPDTGNFTHATWSVSVPRALHAHGVGDGRAISCNH